ncbi:MAG: helix-hairpin-helix domain-containing protein [Nanoarchaeota archaeon]
MTKRVLLLVALLIISFISASCDDGQINLNTASVTELDSLDGIGPVKANTIISTRPFSSVDDLINVDGIKNKTLTKIKNQGLACVEKEDNAEDNSDNSEENPIQYEEISNELVENLEQEKEVAPKKIQTEIINLNPKDIKTESDIESSDKNIGLYSFIVFCILLGILFMLKKKRRKTEFEP